MDKKIYTREIITLEPNSNIGFREITSEMIRPYTPYHWHDIYELVYILEGSSTIQKMSHSVQSYFAGDIICTPPYVIHEMRSTPDTHFILAMIPTSFMQKYIPDIDDVYFELSPRNNASPGQKNSGPIQKILKCMLETQKSKKNGYPLRFQSLLFELIYQLYHYHSKPIEAISKYKNTRNYIRLQDIIAYVYKNYQTQISIENIAKEVHLQPQYFCHYFKKI